MTELHDEVVTLVDEEGKEHDFMVLDIIMVNESEYAIMIPTLATDEEVAEEEQEAIIFRIDETEGEQALTVVEDDAEWDAVAAAWEELADLGDDEEDDEE
ncbi:MAG: DUF1292 domain-containing protein [Firmicutes bacterium]|nr:DUF1292 domain-containing protein [Bacillota bacterium]